MNKIILIIALFVADLLIGMIPVHAAPLNEQQRHLLAQIEVLSAEEKKDLAQAQSDYLAQGAKLATAEKQVSTLQQSLHQTAKERDVVVIFFAFAFAIGVFSSLGKYIANCNIFEQMLIGAGLLACGYGIGRYILFYLSHLIP